MNRVVWVGLALFLLTMIGAPNARADSYQPASTSASGYFHSAAAFGGVAFDMTAEAGRRSAHRIARWDHHAEAGGNTGDNDNQGNDNDQGSMGTTSGTDPGSGTGSCGCSTSSDPSPTAATPEPSTYILMILGVGLLFLTRKRFLPSVRNT